MAGPASGVSSVLMTGPLAPFAEVYSAELGERGYFAAVDLTRDRIEEFLVWQRAGGRHRCQWSRPGLVCLQGVLRGLGVAVEEPGRASSPADLLLSSFGRYLLVERGLAAGTVRGYVAHARSFLDGLSSAGLDGLQAGDVTDAVLRGAASGVSVSATQYPGRCFAPATGARRWGGAITR